MLQMWGHFILSQTFLANQDEFLRWKSSLTDISCKLGSISPPEIIPTRLFLQIRINFSAGNHPSQTFLANQDAFLRRKSSLQELFFKSGCIPTTKIIPARLFPRIRINSPTGNHLSQPFLSNQDAFRCPKSSLQEETCKPGLLPHQNASPAVSKSSRSSFSAIDSFSSISSSSHTRLFPSQAWSGAMPRSFATVGAISFMLTFSGFSPALKSFLRPWNFFPWWWTVWSYPPENRCRAFCHGRRDLR